MDTIKFIVEDYVDEVFGFRFPTISIYINNQNLISLVDRIEQRNRILRGDEPSHSHYLGHDLRYSYDFRNEFLGLQSRPYSVLLTCTCTFEECNCLMAKITIYKKVVVWREIKSPWLSINSPSPWVPEAIALELGWNPFDYSGLGPFAFEKRKYMKALDEITAQSRLFRFIAAFHRSFSL